VETEVKESGRFERTLTVQIDDAELAAATKKAAAKLSRNIKIKGFRPGKAPLQVIERHVGADYLRSEAIEEAIQVVVPEAIDEAGLDPVRQRGRSCRDRHHCHALARARRPP